MSVRKKKTCMVWKIRWQNIVSNPNLQRYSTLHFNRINDYSKCIVLIWSVNIIHAGIVFFIFSYGVEFALKRNLIQVAGRITKDNYVNGAVTYFTNIPTNCFSSDGKAKTLNKNISAQMIFHR